jgi:excisionase family DNA binding protein
MPSDDSPLFVRLPAADAQQLDMAVAASGKTKRQLVSEAVREHLTDDGMVVGRVSIQEIADEVMTLTQTAALLKLEESAILTAAESHELPGQRIAGHWRFSRSALLAWLSNEGAQARPN